MAKWKYLCWVSAIAVGVLAFLRVVSNEILAVERRLKLAEAEEQERRARRRWEQAA